MRSGNHLRPHDGILRTENLAVDILQRVPAVIIQPVTAGEIEMGLPHMIVPEGIQHFFLIHITDFFDFFKARPQHFFCFPHQRDSFQAFSSHSWLPAFPLR